MIALGFAHRLEVLAPAVFLLALVTEMYRPAMQAAVAGSRRAARLACGRSGYSTG